MEPKKIVAVLAVAGALVGAVVLRAGEAVAAANCSAPQDAGVCAPGCLVCPAGGCADPLSNCP